MSIVTKGIGGHGEIIFLRNDRRTSRNNTNPVVFSPVIFVTQFKLIREESFNFMMNLITYEHDAGFPLIKNAVGNETLDNYIVLLLI